MTLLYYSLFLQRSDSFAHSRKPRRTTVPSSIMLFLVIVCGLCVVQMPFASGQRYHNYPTSPVPNAICDRIRYNEFYYYHCMQHQRAATSTTTIAPTTAPTKAPTIVPVRPDAFEEFLFKYNMEVTHVATLEPTTFLSTVAPYNYHILGGFVVVMAVGISMLYVSACICVD